jgi:macrolide-specific efflux system membrane fusion protein
MAKSRRFKSRRSRVALGILVVVVVAVVAFFVYRGVTGHAEAAVTYTTGVVQRMTLASSIEGTGNIELPQTASVSPAVSGEVSGLQLEVGDRVEKGQVLFTLINPQLDVAVAEAKNAYDKAVLAVEVAKLDLTSAKTNLAQLYASYHTTLQLKQAKAAVAGAELAVTAAENALTSAEIAVQEAEENAAARTVTAPISGVITALSVENGDRLAASGTVALVITDPDVYQATITLAESDINQVKVGQRAILTYDALPDLRQTGKVTRVDATGTNESGVVSYSVVVTPDQLDESVRGGMTVSVTIVTQVAQNVLAVPSSAVKSSARGKYVQILQNGQPVSVEVEVGIANDSYTEIKSGLSEGQEIVIGTSTGGGGTTGTTTRSAPGILEGGGFITEGGGPPAGFQPPSGIVPVPSSQ